MLAGDAPPGRGAPGRGPPGRGAGGRGIGRSTGCADENGLLPTRGVRPPGFGAGRVPGFGTESAPGVGPGRAGLGAGGAPPPAGGAPSGCSAAGAGAAGAGAGAGGSGAGRADGLGPVGFPGCTGALAASPTAAAAPLPVALSCACAGLPPPNDSRSRRATGASTVEDADLTNSPCSLSRARTCLLVTPSSLANSCTRALPATTSPVYEATASGSRPRLGFSYDTWSSGLHGVLMFFATCSVCRDGRANLEILGTRPPRMCPVNRRCAARVRKLAAGSLRVRTAARDAAMHPAPEGYPLCQQSRRIYRSLSTQPPLEAVRPPTLAFDNRHTFAPVHRCVDAPRPKPRAGSRLSLPSSNRQSEPPEHVRGWRCLTSRSAG
jgi:hypothetical protein